jgi:hypothetical protein
MVSVCCVIYCHSKVIMVQPTRLFNLIYNLGNTCGLFRGTCECVCLCYIYIYRKKKFLLITLNCPTNKSFSEISEDQDRSNAGCWAKGVCRWVCKNKILTSQIPLKYTAARTKKEEKKQNPCWVQSVVCARRVNLLVCSLPVHRHSYIGFILAFASSIHNKQHFKQSVAGNVSTPRISTFDFFPIFREWELKFSSTVAKGCNSTC